MSTIAEELTDLQNNLQAAKNAVTAKGGTVGDTGLAGLATEIASIPAGGGGDEPGGNAIITGYNSTTGVISGNGFGSVAGTVYMLDRGTHTYISQATSSWTNSSITLTSPIDLSAIEGDTSIAVVINDGTWSTKWLITGGIPVSGYAKVYVKNPDTGVVRTVAVSSSEWSQFENLAGVYSKQITIGSDVFYSDEVVGIQFGSDFDATSFNHGTLAYFANINQPITIPSTIDTILTSCLNSCHEFNQPLTIPSGVTSIGDNFFGSCFSFNQPLTIPSDLVNIGAGFFNNCRSFNQPLTIPSGVTSIGDNFFGSCDAFNQPLTIPSGVTSIGDNFLYNDYAFNQPLTIPSGVTSIGNNFLYNDYAFNQPLTIPSGVTSIGNGFMQYCYSFNQALILPSGLTSIGNYFMQYCFAFNQPLTVPSSVTSIGTNFLNRCNGLSSLTVNNNVSPTDTNSLATTQALSKMYVKGISVTGSGASVWSTNLPNRTSSPYRKLNV